MVASCRSQSIASIIDLCGSSVYMFFTSYEWDENVTFVSCASVFCVFVSMSFIVSWNCCVVCIVKCLR